MLKHAAIDLENDQQGEEFLSLYAPSAGSSRRSVEDLLRERGLVSPDQFEQAHKLHSQQPGRSIAAILRGMNVVSDADYLRATAETLGMELEVPVAQEVDPHAFALLDNDFCRKHGVLPIRLEDDVLVVGLAEPTNIFLLDQIRAQTGRSTRAVVTPAAEISKLIEQLTAGENSMAVDDIIKDMAEDDVQVVQAKEEDVNDLERAGSESPVIRFVNYLIADAIKQGASDIHIEPKEKALKVRYRIDGILFEAMSPPFGMMAAIISRLKIMANLDIAERRLPQDGRIRAVVQGRKVDLRMSTLPTSNGEKVVIRILDGRSISVPLEALGFSDAQYQTWKHNVEQPHGIVLVTGPTGSGKTTTLYSSLRVLDGNKLNISTVEDPVEYHLAQANQVQVHDKIGMTFSAALRSLLRQDPDVVMLGEIRDAETARIAVQASLTGHMVLSTLHTNDAPSSITRLINIGVEPYLISAALNVILAQRLVRKICQECKQPLEQSDEMKRQLEARGFNGGTVYRGAGCDKCRKTGYSGRLGIYELLVMDDHLRDITTSNPDVTALRRYCREQGMLTLRDDGFRKALEGKTTVDEVLRVTEG